MKEKRHILVTGGAGFIGSHLVDALLANGERVTVLDNFEPYYDISIKKSNIAQHLLHPDYQLIEADIRDRVSLEEKLEDRYDAIIHLAAQAGVRPSIKKPVVCQEINVNGTQNMLEFARSREIKQFVFASSSSVYGVNPRVPWAENDYVLQPISPYASSKVCGELMGHVYTHLYGIRFLALRFFTVFGPRQRPDLAIHKFAKKMLNQEEIPVFGDGSTRRDYTFVGDTVKGILAALDYEGSMYEIFNLGNHNTVSLSEMISTLERVLGVEAIINRMPEQPGDVPQTYADISKAQKLLGYQPQTSFEAGIESFYEWIKSRETEEVV
ncbi:MAG: NAD-dependent epimerase/dehydratase family protein [Bacteroidota bacterium]